MKLTDGQLIILLIKFWSANSQIDKYVTKIGNNEYSTDNVELVLDEDKFKKLCETHNKLESKFCPLMTYHGTSQPFLKSISNILI